MAIYAKIIAQKQSNNHWLAWFHNAPETRASGEFAGDAIWGLLVFSGIEKFKINSLGPVAGTADDAYREFTIQLAD